MDRLESPEDIPMWKTLAEYAGLALEMLPILLGVTCMAILIALALMK